MSEPKRVPLQTLEFPDSLGHAAKKDKDKKLLPSHRFTLTLPEPNEERCPEFNYTQLLKTAEKKRIKELKRKDNNTTNGLDPYDDDDEDNLKEMARKFEAKYGTPASGKKNHKFDGYTDLGAGYDENDSFIDNTDAYDEIVPDEVTTAYGGFYINSGALEFKNANNNTVFNVRNDDDDEDESSEDDEDEEDTPKRSDKRTNSSSECEEGEEIVRDHPAKKQKLDEVEKKPNNDPVIRKKKKVHHQSEEVQNNSLQNNREPESLKKNSEQTRVDNLEKETNGESEEKKKNTKSNDIQRSKTTGEKKFDVKKFVKKVTSNGYDSKKLEEKKETNVDDAIESVVNASRVDVDESSRDTSDSGKSRGAPGTESDCEELDKQECPLPDCLPDDVKEICNNLKLLARTAIGKSKFFSQNVNTLLFSLESKLRVIGTNNIRMQTYRHLAHYLPCTKTTLVNRAKKLHMQYQEGRVKSQLDKLKSIIDRIMPAAEEKYKKECQRIVDEKNFQSPIRDPLSDQNDADGSVNKNTDKMPQKKFPWNDETISIVREMASCRKNYFKISRPRKESLDNFVSSFFETDVLPLWPAGWMKLENLLQCATSNVSPKKKQKKSKDSSVSSNSIVIASGSVNNTPKSETIANNTSHHAFDKGKTISNSYKVNSTENSLNLTITKSNDSFNEKKQISSKHKEKNNSSLTTNKQTENATPPNVPIGKITVVPTAQLLAKPSNNVEKFNPMDLTSNSSLSITPVDYQKQIITKANELKKDTVSIIPFTETTTTTTHNETTNISQQHSHYHSRQELNNQNSVMVSMPIRVLQEAAIETTTTHNRKIEVDHDMDYFNKGEKKQERYYDGRHHKSHETKKRKRESKSDKEKIEQEQKQIEETVAATNYLSQIINDDSPEKKESINIDDLLGSTPASDQEKDDVQMVMRSIQQLQEVLNNSPTNSSVGSSASKSIKNDIQYSLYSKNDNNYRISKEDNQW